MPTKKAAMTDKAPTGDAARSASTGKFVKMATAKRHPSKTVIEKSPKRK
jgi:hypothetical protein